MTTAGEMERVRLSRGFNEAAGNCCFYPLIHGGSFMGLREGGDKICTLDRQFGII